jgi:hypothetical protein
LRQEGCEGSSRARGGLLIALGGAKENHFLARARVSARGTAAGIHMRNVPCRCNKKKLGEGTRPMAITMT